MTTLSRRAILTGSASLVGGVALPFPRIPSTSPIFPHGLQSGDVDQTSAVIWTRTDRPAQIDIEISTTESFRDSRRLPPQDVGPNSDFTTKIRLTDLPPDQTVFYRFTARDPGDVNAVSHPLTGQFHTAPDSNRSIRFAWSGDTVGQGYGIDDTGMRTYATIAQHRPDFLIHSGDTVYADGPLKDSKTTPDGGTWTNRIVTPEKRKVAETLAEYRGQWKYNLLDEHVRALAAICPTFYQWDDHEVLNNWSPSKDLRDDARYTQKSLSVLTSNAARAFHEMSPIRHYPAEPGRIYRKISYGPLLDVFFLDLRSYRGPNTPTDETPIADRERLLGAAQMAWLKRELAASRATWKAIASDKPICLAGYDNFKARTGQEMIAQGDHGSPLDREVEIANLLRFIRDQKITNTVWFTADVHYTAAHFYDPNKATFQEFTPFWEFVSGPLHAGTFRSKKPDRTFGATEIFAKSARGTGMTSLPPSMGLQFFGLADIDGATRQMTVRLMDRDNTQLWSITLAPSDPT